MNINIYKLQKAGISIHALCGLTWLNALLAGVLLIQQQSWSVQQQAYLIGRTPADRMEMILEAEERNRSRVQHIAFEETEMLSDSPIGTGESASSPSVHPAAPFIETAPASSVKEVKFSLSSTQSASEELHNAASASASASSISAIPSTSFPVFGNAVMPVTSVPDWGAMKTPAQWNRSYSQMNADDFVPVPFYDLITLTIPQKDLEKTREERKTMNLLTEKLFYSTRYFGAYDVDADEFTAVHPGIDLKLADGTPVGAVAGGRVHDVRRDDSSLGLHVIIEHRAADGKIYYSIYGHLASTGVKKGDDVKGGKTVGIVGMTGNTSGPHLHLQIDRGEPNESYHSVYWPEGIPSRQEADTHAINPIRFMKLYR